MGAEASKPGDRQTNSRDLPLPVRPRTSTSSGAKRSGLQEAFDCRCIFFPATCFGLSLCVKVHVAHFFAVYSLSTASPLVSSAHLIYSSSMLHALHASSAPFLFPFLFQTSSCASGCGRSDQKGTAASTVLRGVHSINRPRTPLPTTKEREEPIVISSDKVCTKRVSNKLGT